MKNKVIITIVTVMICLLGSVVCFIIYGNKIRNNPPQIDTYYKNDDDFNTRMFKTSYAQSEGNYLISPYSMYVALSMLRDGSNNNTNKELSSVIGSDKAKLLNNDSVHIANAIFLKDTYKDGINKDYVNGLNNDYKAQLLLDKFYTPDVINNWVDKETLGMIKKVLNEMTPDFVLGLANAIAIDVKWQTQFQCGLTRSEEFTSKDDSKMNVEMMHNSYTYGADYIKSQTAEGIIIPYEEETNLEYIAIRPYGSLDDYVKNFSMDELKVLESNKQSASEKLHINLSLPRYTYEFELQKFIPVLQDLGIKDVFNPSKADLTNIMSREEMSKYQIDNLYVSEAIHKSYIELSESGTKAAAVTYIGVSKVTSAGPTKFENLDIKFDKSFMYIIRDKNTKEILFMGAVDKPNEWKGSTC